MRNEQAEPETKGVTVHLPLSPPNEAQLTIWQLTR